jgi:hypothetical protein
MQPSFGRIEMKWLGLSQRNHGLLQCNRHRMSSISRVTDRLRALLHHPMCYDRKAMLLNERQPILPRFQYDLTHNRLSQASPS